MAVTTNSGFTNRAARVVKKLNRVANSLANGVSKAQTIENLADCGWNGDMLTTINNGGVGRLNVVAPVC